MYKEIFNEKVLGKIHENTLVVLEKVGLKILHEGYYPALEAAGARVDKSTHVVKFPPHLIEKTVLDIKKMINDGKKQFLLNGIISSKGEPKLQLKFAGACIEYLDPLTNEVREPSEEDLIRLVKFGESIPEVDYVGNPVCYLRTAAGEPVQGPLQRVMTAALVGKYTTKYGSNEVWNEKELDLLIELGIIVRGGKDAYNKKPCFVTAKETIAPLYFPKEDGKVLHMLAERGLPCTIIPMPISGVTCPTSIASNIVMTAAEVLGVMTAIHCSVPDAMIGGGVISGVMDMKTGSASFAAPEAILQDLGAAMLFENLYGQDFGMGTGYIDALYPGAQSSVEIYAKMLPAFETGRYNYACGLLLAGKRWSPVQALISIEMSKYIYRNSMEIKTDANAIPLDVFEEVGIRGNYLAEEHTLTHFREDIWLPDLLQRKLTQHPDTDTLIERAKDTWSDFVKKTDIEECAVQPEVAKEIDNWTKKAVKILAE